MNIHSFSRTCAASLVAIVLGGCANMSGIGGTSEYSCKAPQGVQCDSVSGNYYNSLQNNLPSQRGGTATPPQNAAPAGAAAARPAAATQLAALTSNVIPASTARHPPAAYTTMPLRSAARVLRLWVKPWEDADGDLMDQTYVYVPIDNGRWLVDHSQRRIREAYAPIRAPRAAGAPVEERARPASAEAVTAPLPPDLAKRLEAARAGMRDGSIASGENDAR